MREAHSEPRQCEGREMLKISNRTTQLAAQEVPAGTKNTHERVSMNLQGHSQQEEGPLDEAPTFKNKGALADKTFGNVQGSSVPRTYKSENQNQIKNHE